MSETPIYYQTPISNTAEVIAEPTVEMPETDHDRAIKIAAAAADIEDCRIAVLPRQINLN